MHWQGKPLGRGRNLDVHVIDIASAANLSLGLDLARRTGLKCNWTYLSYQETSSQLDLTECWLADWLTDSHQLCSQTKVAANECSADETQSGGKNETRSTDHTATRAAKSNKGRVKKVREEDLTHQSHTLPQTEIHTHTHIYICICAEIKMWRRDSVVNS